MRGSTLQCSGCDAPLACAPSFSGEPRCGPRAPVLGGMLRDKMGAPFTQGGAALALGWPTAAPLGRLTTGTTRRRTVGFGDPPKPPPQVHQTNNCGVCEKREGTPKCLCFLGAVCLMTPALFTQGCVTLALGWPTAAPLAAIPSSVFSPPSSVFGS